MRRVEREELRTEIAQALATYQAEANRQRQGDGFSAQSFWKNRRDSQTLSEVFAALKRMAGADEACMYCTCSEAGDIEHFRPKADYVERMFQWENLLLCCGICGRMKLDKFPLADGEPLLIDPSSDDPWAYLDFQPRTGNIVARTDPSSGEESLKGKATVEILQLDRRQRVANLYKKASARIVKIVEQILAEGFAERHLDELRNADGHGLLGWCFLGAGQGDFPYRTLRESDPNAWNACQQAFR
jgi:uncharacterized protein (TIGR02646 family)